MLQYTSTEGGPRNRRNQIMHRLAELKAERSSWDGHYRECAEQFMPRATRFYAKDRNVGTKKHNKVIDNTGIRANRILGAGMMSGATSPARPWFRVAHPDDELMEFQPVKEWMADVQQMLLGVFARANTYPMLHQLYEELGVFGTHAVIGYDSFDKVIHHYNSPTGEYFLDVDYFGNVNTLGREFERSVGAIVKEFGIDNCSQTVRNLFNNGNLSAGVPVLHLVEPRADRDPRKYDQRNKAWSSCYIEAGAENIGDKYLREGGFENFPVLAPRWHKIANDTYGQSPAMDALGDGQSLQHEQLRKANAIDYQTKPPIQLPTSARGQEANFLPGGVAYFDTTDGRNAARTLWDVNLNLQHLREDIQDVRDRINSAFYADLFLMLSNVDRTNMTATEVAERHEEKLVQLGPVLERLHNELLAPLVENTFARCLQVGMVPPAPKELQGQDLQVEFISTLAQAQRAVGVNAVDRFVANLGVVAQFKPDVLDKFDQDKWADSYADMMGIDPELIVAGDKVALIRKDRAQAQAAMQKAEQAATEAKAAQSLGSVKTDEANLATDLMSQFSGYSSPAGSPV
jgi:hypothetical protein